MIWAVYNGYLANGHVAVLVSAPTEEDAKVQAREVLAQHHQANEPGYCEPVEAVVLELPVQVELG